MNAVELTLRPLSARTVPVRPQSARNSVSRPWQSAREVRSQEETKRAERFALPAKLVADTPEPEQIRLKPGWLDKRYDLIDDQSSVEIDHLRCS